MRSIFDECFADSKGDANQIVTELIAKLVARPESQNFKFFVTYSSIKTGGHLETVAGAHWDPLHDGTWTYRVETPSANGIVVITWIKA